VTYDGSYSNPAQQKLFLQDFVGNRWVQFGTTQTVGTSDVTFTFTTKNVARYVSAGRVVRLRVLGQSSTSAFNARADLVRFTVVY
jgi:hypothetical protein